MAYGCLPLPTVMGIRWSFGPPMRSWKCYELLSDYAQTALIRWLMKALIRQLMEALIKTAYEGSHKTK
jgi:hypothetical protein